MTFKQKLGPIRWTGAGLLLTAIIMFFAAPFLLFLVGPLGFIGLLLIITSIPNSITIEERVITQDIGSRSEVSLSAADLHACTFRRILPLGGGTSFRLSCFEIKGSGNFPKTIYIESWGWGSDQKQLYANLEQLLLKSQAKIDDRTKNRLQSLATASSRSSSSSSQRSS